MNARMLEYKYIFNLNLMKLKFYLLAKNRVILTPREVSDTPMGINLSLKSK